MGLKGPLIYPYLGTEYGIMRSNSPSWLSWTLRKGSGKRRRKSRDGSIEPQLYKNHSQLFSSTTQALSAVTLFTITTISLKHEPVIPACFCVLSATRTSLPDGKKTKQP